MKLKLIDAAFLDVNSDFWEEQQTENLKSTIEINNNNNNVETIPDIEIENNIHQEEFERGS